MLVKRGRSENNFNIELQFKFDIKLESDTFYVFSFDYLINYDLCDQNQVAMKILLQDDNLLREVFFDSDLNIDPNEYKNTKWNNFILCFQVIENNYTLFIQAESLCEIDKNNAFVAIDEIKIKETTEEDFEESCKDFRLTSKYEDTTEEITQDRTDSTTSELDFTSTNISITSPVGEETTDETTDELEPTSTQESITSQGKSL